MEPARYVGFTGATSGATSTQEILTWSYSAISNAHNVVFNAYPQYLQLYPRNRVTNAANVQVAGTENAGGFSGAVLRVYRNGTQVGTDQSQVLNYAGGTAAFSFTTTITAELAQYDVELLLRNGVGQEFFVRRAKNIVSGDVFIIEGQSNATTYSSSGTGNGDAYISPFVRTFGVANADQNATLSSRSWYVANGSGSDTPYDTSGSLDPEGAIGRWGLVLGNRLVTQNNVPVAILNGGNGGQPISFFQRNDSNPGDLSTNYGRLLESPAGSRRCRCRPRSFVLSGGE